MHPTEWKLTLRDPNGNVVRETPWMENVLTREGSLLIMETFFRNNQLMTPVSFQVGLTNSAPGLQTTGLTLSDEVSGGGYSRLTIRRLVSDWPVLAQVPNPDGSLGPYRIETVTVTFVAQGDPIGPFINTFLMALVPITGDPAVLAPLLVCAASSLDVNEIPAGNSLDVTIRLKLTA